MAENNWRKTLATLLREARGMESKVSLASRSGISDKTIALIEGETIKSRPRAETIIRLAIATQQDPEAWLTAIDYSVSKNDIDMLRKLMIAPRPEELESASKIKEELRAYVEERIASLEGGKKIYRDIIDYVDARVGMLSKRLTDLEEMVRKM